MDALEQANIWLSRSEHQRHHALDFRGEDTMIRLTRLCEDQGRAFEAYKMGYKDAVMNKDAFAARAYRTEDAYQEAVSRAEQAEAKLASARKVITMFDVTRSDALTAGERQNITLATMPALLDENRNNLCLLLARYEQVVVEVEADLSQAREEVEYEKARHNETAVAGDVWMIHAEAAEQREKVLRDALKKIAHGEYEFVKYHARQVATATLAAVTEVGE